MNKRTIALIIALIIFVVGGALAIALIGGQTAANACKSASKPTHYTVTIQGGKVSNNALTAQKCDTLTITNEDSAIREVAFGPHDHHVAYDGIEERIIHQNESVTVTLIKAGTFHWHDHIHDEVEGNFTVTQ